jgi:type IV pilus assembly protein PilX
MNTLTFNRQQSGAALVVGLVLLVVISILAVSSINTATTELAMARNDMNYENAFQAAETGLENALSRGMWSTIADTNLVQNIVNADGDTNEDVATVISFQQTTMPPADDAYSLGSGVSAYHFRATATARSKRAGVAGADTDRDASAVHTQSFYIIGPASPTL